MIAEISVQELEQRLAAGQPTLLVDVRQPWESELVAIPGSVPIPLGALPGRAQELEPPADALIVVYCHHGVRSQSGAAILSRLGFGKVASLAGGIDDWARVVDPSLRRY